MEGNLRPRALIPGDGAPSPQVGVQANQVAFAAPAAANQMPQDVGNGVKASRISKEDDPGGKGEATATATASQWPRRVKWSADMAKLLVSALSYMDADIDADHVSSSRVKRMGKWKLVSSAMAKRGFAASPQQCEDKFHDLNKRYKRVTELLGYGTACGVVKKPALLEQMNIPEKLKEEARKQLSSKNLHYEEMCSYHNRNRQSLPDDPSLQRMLRSMARGSPVEQGVMECPAGNAGEDNHVMVLSDGEEEGGDEFSDDPEGGDEDHHLAQDAADDMKAIQIKRERLKIKRETVEMRLRHMERMRSIKEQDRELQKMKLDNEMMELENDKLELELERKIKEMEMMGIKPKRII